MISTQEMLRQLVNSESGDTELDRHLAIALGYVERESSWTRPDGIALRALPRFTSDVQDAVDLAEQVDGVQFGGAGWESGRASAKLGDGNSYEARTLACAICLAVLAKHIQASRRNQ